MFRRAGHVSALGAPNLYQGYYAWIGKVTVLPHVGAWLRGVLDHKDDGCGVSLNSTPVKDDSTYIGCYSGTSYATYNTTQDMYKL